MASWREALTRGPYPGRRDRAEPLARPTREDANPAASTRYAPSFVIGDDRRPDADHPYDATTVAAFLGWGETKVKEALGALELIERGTFQSPDFYGMTQKQARAAVTGVRQAERHARRLGIG